MARVLCSAGTRGFWDVLGCHCAEQCLPSVSYGKDRRYPKLCKFTLHYVNMILIKRWRSLGCFPVKMPAKTTWSTFCWWSKSQITFLPERAGTLPLNANFSNETFESDQLRRLMKQMLNFYYQELKKVIEKDNNLCEIISAIETCLENVTKQVIWSLLFLSFISFLIDFGL